MPKFTTVDEPINSRCMEADVKPSGTVSKPSPLVSLDSSVKVGPKGGASIMKMFLLLE